MAVQLKYEQKTVKLQMSNVTVANISIVFKLDRSKPIFLMCEVEGQAILPMANGEFDVLSLVDGATYKVEGESQPQPGPVIPQFTARRHLTPPPAVAGPSGLHRPAFTFARTSPGFTANASPKMWRKTVIFAEMKEGKAEPIYQVYLKLNEDLANVDKVRELVEKELGIKVTLLDNKLLEIQSCQATEGAFWQGSRKIYAVAAVERKKRSHQTTTSTESEMMKELKKMREEIKASSRNSNQDDASTRQDIIREYLKEVFKCQVCQNITAMPAAACTECENIIGCIPCIEQWMESGGGSLTCPLCRSNAPYERMPVIRQVQEVLEVMVNEQSVPVSTADDSN